VRLPRVLIVFLKRFYTNTDWRSAGLINEKNNHAITVKEEIELSPLESSETRRYSLVATCVSAPLYLFHILYFCFSPFSRTNVRTNNQCSITLDIYSLDTIMLM